MKIPNPIYGRLRHTNHSYPSRLYAPVFLVMWLFASGLMLDTLQLFAWARMWSQNVQSQSATEALVTTLSAEGKCELCHFIENVKQEQSDNKSSWLQLSERALLLPLHLEAYTLPVPATTWNSCIEWQAAPPQQLADPETPPPRFSV